MKYLLFNLSVFAALAYLIVGGNSLDLSLPVKQETAKPTQVDLLKSVDNINAPAPAKVPLPPAQKVAEQKPVPEKQVVTTPPKPQTPPALPQPVEVAKIEPKPVPSRASTTVAKQPVPAVSAPAAPEESLEDMRSRSRDLRKIVADMEQMFAEKLTR